MEKLTAKYADRAVRSIFIYTREAHPGENYPHLTTMDQKRAHARAMKKELGITREMYLDSLDGVAHRAYGMLPNMTWIINKGGMVLYKAAWTLMEDVEQALADAVRAMDERDEKGLMPFYEERVAWRWRDNDRFRAGLERAGPQAVSDFYGVKKKPKVPPGSLG